jgi:hypothetical protein
VFIIQLRCSSSEAMLRRRTSPHRLANTVLGRSQFLIQAFQASFRESWGTPGNSPQSTATQRLLVGTLAVNGGLAAEAGPPCGAISGTGAGSFCCLVVVHATRVPTISASEARRRRWKFMGLILLEALLALAILVAIVWWTMFSGRKRVSCRPRSSRRRTKKCLQTPNKIALIELSPWRCSHCSAGCM